MTVKRIKTTRFLSNMLDPSICPGCQHALACAQTFCSRCRQRLSCVVNPCRLCGLQNQNADELCAACLYDPPRWQRMIAPLQYRGFARELLLQLKFSESLYLANTLTATVVHHFSGAAPPEVLLPVPLHRQRLLERGFNQAYEIARLLSSRLNIKLDDNTLTRIRHTQAQAGLSATAREKNILKAFHCKPSDYQHVALIDDIITTGSTASEITKILHQTGIKTVEIWGMARVVK